MGGEGDDRGWNSCVALLTRWTWVWVGSRSWWCTAKSLQLCPTLCDPTDSSPPGFAIPGILQARTLEWVAISFSNAWKWKVKMKLLSRVQLFATTTPWTAAYQAPASMGFSRQEYWSGLPLPSPGDAQGSLMCCSPWGHKESDTTEQLNWTDTFTCNFSRILGK